MKRISLALPAISFMLAAVTYAQQGKDDAWVTLFDGKTLDGWTTLDKKPVTKGWVVEDGLLHRTDTGGDIYTEKEYANFIVEFEWRSVANTNSGVKYRMKLYGKEYLGPEYQILDDGEPPKTKNPKMRTASIYELFAPNDKRKLNPPGQWNTGRIVANGTRIEHWINGEKAVDANTASADWAKAVAASKFNKYPEYGRNPSGRIMLQNHGTEVWFRNIRIKLLP